MTNRNKDIKEEITRMVIVQGMDEREAYRVLWDESEKIRNASAALFSVCYNWPQRYEDITLSDAVKMWIRKVGIRLATTTMASLANCYRNDGRISIKAWTWAASVRSAWNEASAKELLIYTHIHRALLDQMIKAFIRITEENKAKRAENRKARKA